MDIINHPACTEVIGAPADITDGSCLGLPVAIVEDQYGMWSVSCWKPSTEELAVLMVEFLFQIKRELLAGNRE